MEPEELKEMVLREPDEKTFISSHGINNNNIRDLLVYPHEIELIDILGEIKKYWLVLDELPEKQEGYQIIYDETENIFGLATKSTKHDKQIGFLVGLYGSFTDALQNM